MGLRQRLDRLDERTGAAAWGSSASRVGGYWNFFAGLVITGIGIWAYAADRPGSVGFLVIGPLGVVIGLSIGPKGMLRRLVRRRGR